MSALLFMLTLSNLDFDLPPELTAQTALPDRTTSHLLAVRCAGDAMHSEDRQFTGLVDYLRPGDLLVFNDIRVIKARFFGQKANGGKVEVLVGRLLDERTMLAQIRSSGSSVGSTMLRLADTFDVMVGSCTEPFFTLRFPQPALGLIEQYGHLPLPPCIKHDPNSFDGTYYQTVYARNPGAVAAPAVGLHLDDAPFTKLDAMDIRRGFPTLYVGAGTFQPVRVENITEHRMHSKQYEVTPELAEAIHATRVAGDRIITVGTTSMRALESAAQLDGTLNACNGEASIFITPGYRFRAVNLLVTSFHLPKSTLLMLVSAPAGMSAIQEAYQHATAQRYCFFSYGDAMLLACAPTEPGELGETQSF